MPFNLAQVPGSRLSAADMGVPDYAGALSRGFTLGNQPKKQSEELLASMLENKIKGAKARFAPQMEEAHLNHLLASTTGLGDEHGMAGLRKMLLQSQVNDALYNQNLGQSLFGGGSPNTATESNNPFQSSGGSVVPSLHENISNGIAPPASSAQLNDNQNESVVNQGNPNLYHLDQAYNSDPRARRYLEGKGYKQTQTTKYDPRTGSTSVITTSPGGKVTLTTTAGAGGPGVIPLTNAMKTQQQNIITNVPKASRLIDAIKIKPSPVEFPFYRKGARKEHASLVKEAAETYAKAKGWPNTGESIKAAEQIIERGVMESDSDYRARLAELQKELDRNVEDAQMTLYPNRQPTSDASANVIEYVRKNGRLVPKN